MLNLGLHHKIICGVYYTMPTSLKKISNCVMAKYCFFSILI